jgi:hypothetical protein
VNLNHRRYQKTEPEEKKAVGEDSEHSGSTGRKRSQGPGGTLAGNQAAFGVEGPDDGGGDEAGGGLLLAPPEEPVEDDVVEVEDVLEELSPALSFLAAAL